MLIPHLANLALEEENQTQGFRASGCPLSLPSLKSSFPCSFGTRKLPAHAEPAQDKYLDQIRLLLLQPVPSPPKERR
ncbi:hypothetical protein MC885_007846 [Smutsia gigantea]|nr:hypothetical protein MC885_007846 [Smutsia gigantea]